MLAERYCEHRTIIISRARPRGLPIRAGFWYLGIFWGTPSLGMIMATESDLHIEPVNTYEEDSDKRSWGVIEVHSVQ